MLIFSRRFSKKNADYSSDFFKDQRTDRFYKFYKQALTLLSGTNTKPHWHRGYGFLRSAKRKDMGSSPALDQIFFV